MTMLAMGVPRDYQRTKFARSAREVQMHLKFKPWGSRRVSSLGSNVFLKADQATVPSRTERIARAVSGQLVER
jgi:hypothetical protein